MVLECGSKLGLTSDDINNVVSYIISKTDPHIDDIDVLFEACSEYDAKTLFVGILIYGVIIDMTMIDQGTVNSDD